MVRSSIPASMAARPWYAMELLEGTTLAGQRNSIWKLDGPTERHLPPLAGVDPYRWPRPCDGLPIHSATEPRELACGQLARVLTVTQRLLGPLAFVHGEGIAHRDLKPEDVVLCDGDQPVLVDRGVAWRSAGIMGREVLDLALEVVGPPAYMAPEQIWGKPRRLAHRRLRGRCVSAPRR